MKIINRSSQNSNFTALKKKILIHRLEIIEQSNNKEPSFILESPPLGNDIKEKIYTKSTNKLLDLLTSPIASKKNMQKNSMASRYSPSPLREFKNTSKDNKEKESAD